MGKRYLCDYCNKAMVAAPAIVKTHNKGLVHQRLVQEHYQQFKDIETILVEESKKKPCVRFASGECKFGSICHFSHYTVEQIQAMGEYVASKNRPKDVIFPSFEELVLKLMDEKSNKQQDSTDGTTVMYDKNGITHTFPWTYNTILDNYPDRLPPSVKRLKIEDFEDAKIETWGRSIHLMGSEMIITKQQELTAINETYVTDIMRALQDMSKDSGIVLLAQTDPFISNASILLTDEETDDEHDKADTDNVFAESEEVNINSTEEKSPKMKNILRWLPPKKPKKINYTQKREEQEIIAKEERNALKARQINAERIAYVMALLKGDFWSTVYMYGEVQRIINNREVLDDLSSIAIFAHFVVDATDLEDFVDAIINANKGRSDSNSLEQPTLNNIVIVVPDSGNESETNEDKNKDDTRPDAYHAAMDKYLKLQNENVSFTFDKDRRMVGSPYSEMDASEGPMSLSKKYVKKIMTTERIPTDSADHERRLKAIKEHMEEHFTSTLYLYNEAKRIRTTGVVMDELRKMAEYINYSQHAALKKIILECGREPEVKKARNIWGQPNNIVINIQKDPENDNVIN
ncbi:unnamed protein product [Spodoptera exigua]|nr:unnamed protein product [Spodoptera exigua]